MTTISWKSATSGAWSVTTNWTPTSTPDFNDLFILATGANYTASIDTFYFIASLNVASANATVAQGAGVNLTINGTLTVSAGLVGLNAANTINGQVILAGGQIDLGAAGALGTAGLALAGGVIRATANQSLANGFTISTNATATFAAAHGVTLTMTGQEITNNGSKLVFGATGQDGVIIENFSGSPIGVATGLVINAGAVISGNYLPAVMYPSLTIASGATLDMNGHATNYGAIQHLLGGGTLTSSNLPTEISVQAGVFDGSITGNISMNFGGAGSPLLLTGVNTYSGYTTIGAGTVQFTNARALPTGSITLNDKAFLYAQATTTLANAITISNGASVAITVDNTHVLTFTGTINFAGFSDTLTISQTTVGQQGPVSFAGATITGFNSGDHIVIENLTYNSGYKIVFLSQAAGVQNFALEDAANNILYRFNFGGSYGARLALYAGVSGDGHELIGINHPSISYVDTRDLNADGASDVLLQSGGNVVDWLARGGVAIGAFQIGANLGGYSVVGAGDFGGDGVADVLLQNGGAVVEWTIGGGGQVISGGLLGTAGAGFSVVGVGDFNGDGIADVVLQNGGVFVDWIVQNGVAVSGNILGTGLAGWSVAATGDFNGDGVTDILLQNNGVFVAWDMAGGVVGGGAVIGSAAGWTAVGAGDFNGDGTTDVILQNGGTIVDWIINNAYGWGNVLGTGLAGWSVVGTGDYNADGVSDILLQNGGLVVDWLMHAGKVASGLVMGNAGSYGVKV